MPQKENSSYYSSSKDDKTEGGEWPELRSHINSIAETDLE